MLYDAELKITLTHYGRVISNTLILRSGDEIYLPSITISEDELLEYDNTKYELNLMRHVFNDGDGYSVYYYSLIPIETPITRLVLDEYIDDYFEE